MRTRLAHVQSGRWQGCIMRHWSWFIHVHRVFQRISVTERKVESNATFWNDHQHLHRSSLWRSRSGVSLIFTLALQRSSSCYVVDISYCNACRWATYTLWIHEPVPVSMPAFPYDPWLQWPPMSVNMAYDLQYMIYAAHLWNQSIEPPHLQSAASGNLALCWHQSCKWCYFWWFRPLFMFLDHYRLSSTKCYF